MSKSLKKLIDINRLREFKNKLVGTGSAYVQTGAVDQTVAGTKTFSKPIVGSVTGSSGSCTGNAATATTATTAKACTGNAATATQFSANATVALTGDATGTSAGSKKGWSVPVTLANSGVTAGTYGPSADVTGNNNATISVPEITVDAKGRVTSVVNRTLTCKNNTYTVNNATLTIQKNGTNVATFTSNASSNATANITVPTKVSELTNDSGFLTSHQSLSNYVTLNGAQTISGAKTFTGDVVGINKEGSTENANDLYSTTAGSKLTYYTTSNGGTTLTNVPAAVNTTLESRTIRRLSDSNWIVEQICHNSNGLYYRKGINGTWGAWKTFAFTDSNISGNAATATKLAAKRTIALSGAATGTATSFDGSGNITIPVTSLDASKLTGTASVSTTGNAATATTATTAKACTGNAATATKLQTARTINGTSFNGTANITTANWGTARNISITDGTNTSTAVSVNGSANVSLNLPATIKANLTGNCSGSSGSCTGNAATATRATQDSDGNQINTTYSKVGHTHDDRYYTETEVNNLLKGKANDSDVVHKSGDETIAGTKTFSNGVLLTDVNAFMAQNGEYTLVLRNDSYNTYLLMSDKGGVPGTWSDARPLTISNSTGVCSINGNASTATKLQTARTIALSGAATGTATSFDGSGNITIPVTSLDASKLTGTASVSTTGNAATATTATTAEACTGNAATATKLATARTIALSGAATGTATDFDGSGNITIPVTALSPSAIRAQWYAAYPDGPEAHNAMWGGRDITAAFDAGTVSANIANGTFRDIFPGDYITKQVTISGTAYTVNWVVADCDYWINKGNTVTTAHHVVIVPQAPIFSANMNSTNTAEGGYAGSRMYRETIPACARGIVSAFGSSHILTFRDHLTRDLNTSAVSSGITTFTGAPNWSGAWYSQECNLMSEKMVYGAPICAAGAMDNTMATRQMSAFRLSEKLINYNRQGWWLRDVVSSALFALVYGSGGNADTGDASHVFGVRPFALLK